MKDLPKTADGIETEVVRRSKWNGKSFRKNLIWLLIEKEKLNDRKPDRI